MTLLDATNALADALAAENAALLALDFPAAGRMLARKQAVTAAFTAAQAAGLPPGPARPGLTLAATRLQAAAEENRRLLQRAMAVQTRVLGVLASAAQRTQPTPRYGRRGAIAAAPRTAWALSASA